MGDTCGSSPIPKAVPASLSGVAKLSICRVLGTLSSGVRRVYLFGTEVVHDHSIGVSRKCAAGKTNGLGVTAYRDRFLPRTGTYPGAIPAAALPHHKSSLPQCLWIYIAIISVQ